MNDMTDAEKAAAALERLGQILGAAFNVNDPAMLDWATVAFRLRELESIAAKLEGGVVVSREDAEALVNGPLPIEFQRHAAWSRLRAALKKADDEK